MKTKSTTRSLAGLKAASSARVMNLLEVQRIHGTTEDYLKRPLFQSSILNASILLKHRLRGDESFLFEEPVTNAMKIVLPLDKGDLRLGGTSFFFGQRGFEDLMQESCRYSNRDMTQDLKTLATLNELPSLDPFLVSERFDMEGIDVADCYFELSPADKSKMLNFVAKEISALILLAYQKNEAIPSRSNQLASGARLASALLAIGSEDQLDPLRRTLMVEEGDFRRGIFSWRGFLYYKWRFMDLVPKIKDVMREIVELPLVRSDDVGDLESARQCKRRLVRQVSTVNWQVHALINAHGQKYAEVVKGNDPNSFREFIMEAPTLFIDLGEKFGGVEHIVSFWRYRFPKRRIYPMRADDALSLFNDFLVSVGHAEDVLDGAEEDMRYGTRSMFG